jgi:DNA-binding CsgD family transcriptional regulator
MNWGDHMKVLDSHNHWSTDAGAEVLEQLARADTPAIATDPTGHVTYWNPAAERLFGRAANQTLGRRCYEVLGWRDVFGNRFCHENCAVLSMVRKGEPVHGFEVSTAGAPQEAGLNVTVMKVPSSRSESHTLVHILQPIDRAGRLERALERLGASHVAEPVSAAAEERRPPARPVALAKTPPLTEREREILRWLADGLQNKEIARELGISLATVRNHVHNMLEKLDVHSKLEAVSLAFRQGWVSARGAEPAHDAERVRA